MSAKALVISKRAIYVYGGLRCAVIFRDTLGVR